MKPFPLFIALCSVFAAAVLPVPSVAADPPSSAVTSTAWVWPLPPEKPRVQHLKTFITPQDLGAKRGFFARLWEFIAGSDTVDRIISPHGIASDGAGKVYVADWGAGQVHFFDFEKKKYDQFGKTKLGNLISPIGAALDADGLLYIADSALRRIFVFDDGKNKRVIGDDSLQRPTGIAVNARERLLYVVDTTAHTVAVFGLDGKQLRTFGKRGGGDGEFNYPTHIALDGQGSVYVMDSLNFRVQVFDKDGRFLSKFGSNGTAIGEFMKPKGIAVDSEGHIWVSDGLRNSIQVFDRTGQLLLIFGQKGIEPGQFDIPTGIFIDSRDRLFVADSYNYRVQMFQYLKQSEGK